MRFILLSVTILFGFNSYACIGGVFDAKAQALSQQLQAEQQAAQQLMNLADKRFEAEAKHGKEILQAWINYQQEKGKLEREFNRAPVKMAEAELAMQREQIKVKKECREKANQYQTERTAEVTRDPVSANPTNLAGSYRRLNNQYNLAYKQCMRDPLVLEELQIAVKNYNLMLKAIRQDQDDAVTKIQELDRITRQAQEYTLRIRSQQRDLFDYHEGVIRQMQARAISMAQKIGSIRQTGAALQCFFQMIQSIGSGSGSGGSAR